MIQAYLGLGANLGKACETLKSATLALAKTPGITLTAQSHIYQSAPINATGEDYYNNVLAISTSLSPIILLTVCQRIEKQFGRERPYFNAPRTLDIDILLYGTLCSHDEQLILPHPRMHTRAFVLLPLLELVPDIDIPGHGPALNFLPGLKDQRIVRLNID